MVCPGSKNILKQNPGEQFIVLLLKLRC